MAFQSLEQLRNMTWPTRDAAIKDLRRNAFKERGADYELREYTSGSWQLMELDDVAQEQPAVTTVAARTARGGGSPQRKMAAGKKAADKQPPAPVAKKAAGKKAAAKPEPEPPAKAAPAPEVEADPVNDMSALPDKDGPYTICVIDQIAQFDLPALALKWSRAVGYRVAIVKAGVKALRTIDGRLGGRATVRKQRAAPVRRGDGALSDLAQQAFDLATRKQGVTRPELMAISKTIGWKAYVQRTGVRRGHEFEMKTVKDVVTYFLRKS